MRQGMRPRRFGPRRRPAWGAACVLLAALGLLLLALAGPARAETLYDRLGGQEGITRVVSDMYRHVLADGRVRAKFDDVDTEFIKHELVQQICQISGGPCRYHGPSMRGGHQGLGITERDFNAVVEDLEQGMTDAGTPWGARGQLLALLAPMEGQIVSR